MRPHSPSAAFCHAIRAQVHEKLWNVMIVLKGPLGPRAPVFGLHPISSPKPNLTESQVPSKVSNTPKFAIGYLTNQTAIFNEMFSM